MDRRAFKPNRSWTRLRDHCRGLYFGVRFDKAQERDFQAWYAQTVRSQVQWIVFFPALLFVAFAIGSETLTEIKSALFGARHVWMADAVVFGVILPANLLHFVVLRTRLYADWHLISAQIIAPVNAVAIGALDALLRPQGYSLAGWSVMTLLGVYFAYGLMRHHALNSVFVMLIGYAILAAIAGVVSAQWYFDYAVLLLVALSGASSHQTMMTNIRTAYLHTLSLHETARRDPLTKLYNRRMFDDHTARVWQQAMRTETPLGLLMIDMDYFKAYNDHLGHQAGDECLQRMAQALANLARRPLDLTARYGGEEFAILLYDVDRPRIDELCRELALRIAEMAIPHPVSPISRYVTASIGGACVQPVAGRTVAGFIQLADEALYAAKHLGRNRVVVLDREYDTLDTGNFRKWLIAS